MTFSEVDEATREIAVIKAVFCTGILSIKSKHLHQFLNLGTLTRTLRFEAVCCGANTGKKLQYMQSHGDRYFLYSA